MLRSTALVALLATVAATTGGCATHHLTRSDRVAAVVVGTVLVGAGALVMTSHGDDRQKDGGDFTLDYPDFTGVLVGMPLLFAGLGGFALAAFSPSAEAKATPTASVKPPSPPSVMTAPAPAYGMR